VHAHGRESKQATALHPVAIILSYTVTKLVTDMSEEAGRKLKRFINYKIIDKNTMD
jgi:hypothetical protein